MAMEDVVRGVVGRMKARDITLPHLFPDFRIIGGASGLDTVVKKVAVLDTPDMSYWIEGGEFLVGNGFIFKDNASSIPSFLREVAEKGAAAVGIKFDRFTAFVDMSEIAACADKLALPVFRIPFRYRFLDIIEKTLFEVNRTSKGSALLQDKSFLLEMESLGELIQELSNRIRKPLYFSSQEESNGAIFIPVGRWGSKGIENVDGYKNAEASRVDFISLIPNFLGIREEARTFGNVRRSRVYFTDVHPLFELHVLFGEEEELSGLEERIIRRGVSAIRALMSEQSALQSLQHREIARTLERLVLGSYSNHEILLQTLHKWDLPNPVPCRIAVIPKDEPSGELIGLADMPYRFACTIGKFHVLLVPWELEATSEKNESALRFLDKYEKPVALGFTAGDLAEIPVSFQDALRVFEYMQRHAIANKTVPYETLLLELALSKLAESDEASRIWSLYWRPLKETGGSAAIRPDIFASALIDVNFRLVDCSAKLNIHYNTARKYADVVERAIGASLGDFRTQVCLLVARNYNGLNGSLRGV